MSVPIGRPIARSVPRSILPLAPQSTTHSFLAGRVTINDRAHAARLALLLPDGVIDGRAQRAVEGHSAFRRTPVSRFAEAR